MRNYYAYIRVSTTKQGEKGSSLGEQRDAITRYAQKHGLNVSEWFEEQETAAKRGRTIFRRVLNQLKKGQAHGLILHKVDRGARNLADWAELAALMDIGVDLHFAHEAMDMQTRGGRLSADIQAVVAADYIRNLRDEVKKGIYGRLKQGCYPFKAPPGYLDNGKGKLKTIDPVQGPLMREAFQLYAAGSYGLHALRAHMTERGLRNTTGRPFNVSGLAITLANPFYYGILMVKGQSFPACHEPLISKELFDACRARAAGRLVSPTRVWGKAEYRYRQLIRCTKCSRRLIAETQRGHVYYRCHSKSCLGTGVREETITESIELPVSYLPMPPELESWLRRAFTDAETQRDTKRQADKDAVALSLSNITARLASLTDLLIDNVIDKTTYQSRKLAMENEQIELREKFEKLSDTGLQSKRVADFIEHTKALKNITQTPIPHKIREIVKTAISNISISGKTVEIQWSNAFQMLFDIGGFHEGALDRQADTTSISSVTDRDELFKARSHERSVELYFAVTDPEQKIDAPPR
jgi:site-specific DNA recombinase